MVLDSDVQDTRGQSVSSLQKRLQIQSLVYRVSPIIRSVLRAASQRCEALAVQVRSQMSQSGG